ncbi:MAG TPA: hypothetical protein VJ896_00705 [Bacteroidales bacterium]|nr:hypothetical protein [Bacteroidales bacterium]
MAIFKKEKFNQLANEWSKYCISVYIPTERSGENKEGAIKLKNQIQKIEHEMAEDLGLKPRAIEEYLEPLRELQEDANLWRHLSDSLIIFKSKHTFYYTTLAIDTREISLISNTFYLLPLLSTFNNTRNFFILTLSQHHNALYEATQNEIGEVITKDIMPENIDEAIGRDVEQKSLQFRSGQTGQGQAMYHGKGEGKDDKKEETIKYLTHLNNGLNDIIEDYEIPLIVAAVDNVFSLFKEISTYKNIYPEFIPGNPDNEDILLIHEKACDILTPYFNQLRKENKKKYVEGKNKSATIKEVLQASYEGAVDTVFIKKDELLWGKFNKEENNFEIHKTKEPLDYCLLDFAAKKAFLQGGKVFLEDKKELPEPDSIANALLRF